MRDGAMPNVGGYSTLLANWHRVRHTVALVHDDACGTARGVEGEHRLHGDLHCGHAEVSNMIGVMRSSKASNMVLDTGCSSGATHGDEVTVGQLVGLLKALCG